MHIYLAWVQLASGPEGQIMWDAYTNGSQTHAYGINTYFIHHQMYNKHAISTFRALRGLMFTHT